MSGTSTSSNSPKGSNILQCINKKIQGARSSKKLNFESDGLYKPLNVERREIRLLHIKPSLKLKEQPQCFLETVSLDDNPQFEALSYTWGDPNLTRPIKLEDRKWYATINLEAGLRYLRSPSEDIVIWVDALCINQLSVDERNSQVLLMKTIFSNAKRVRVWLGEPTRGSDDALLILEDLGHRIPFRDIRLDGKEPNEKHAEYLDELSKRPWWNRVWVQQEYILAKDVMLQCGYRSVDYNSLLKTGVSIEVLKDWDDRLSNCMQTIGYSDELYACYNQRDAYGSKFAMILARGCFKYCTDLRDSIYGFLGLAQEDLADAIKPDYGIPLAEVLQRTAVKHISCTGSLSFLSFTTLKSKNERLVPSWVPEWPRLGPLAQSGSNHAQYLKRFQWHNRNARFEAIRDFKACATRALSFNSTDETTVMLNGNCSGEVTDVCPDAIYCGTNRPLSFRDPIQLVVIWRGFFDQFANHTAFPNSTEGRESPFWRILVGDRYYDGRRSWRNCENPDYEAYQALERALIARGGVTEEASDYWNSFMVASAGRRLFATDRGYIGLGPPEMQKDDHVYILSGGNLPYLLRRVFGPRPRTFELVGDCYLHGIMYGEEAGTDEDYHDVYLE